jgi:hypothetical protein
MQLRDALEEALLFVFLVLAVDGSERGKICRVKYGKKKEKNKRIADLIGTLISSNITHFGKTCIHQIILLMHSSW